MTVSGTPGKGCRPSVPAPPPPPPPVDYEIAVDAALLMTVSTVVSGSGNRTLLDTFDRAMPVPAAVSAAVEHFCGGGRNGAIIGATALIPSFHLLCAG
jgi:hypothetical protein